jgi:hypothetical protein
MPGLETIWGMQEVIWRDSNSQSRKAALRRAVQGQATHIVREVDVTYPGRPKPLNRGHIEDTIQRAQNEFELMKSIGIAVPDVSWQIHTDPTTGAPRTLARVGIVDGIPAGKLPGPQWEAALELVETYKHTSDGYARLSDAGTLDQYIFGAQRDRVGAAALYLVDIEPKF